MSWKYFKQQDTVDDLLIKYSSHTEESQLRDCFDRTQHNISEMSQKISENKALWECYRVEVFLKEQCIGTEYLENCYNKSSITEEQLIKIIKEKGTYKEAMDTAKRWRRWWQCH